jgi:hypothetical protein
MIFQQGFKNAEETKTEWLRRHYSIMKRCGKNMKMKWSHGKTASMYPRIKNFERTSFVNIMIPEQQGILDTTKPRNSSHVTIGGHASNQIFENT